MANFEYIDEAETIAAQEVRRAAEENKTNINSSEKTNYWEELLKDRYEVQKVEEFNALGKGKRSRKQVLVEEICFPCHMSGHRVFCCCYCSVMENMCPLVFVSLNLLERQVSVR